MNWEKYQQAYKKAPSELRELLDSEKIPQCVRNTLEKKGLVITLRKKVTAEIAAYTVSIQTIDETVKNLAQAGIPDALQFLAEIQTCINLDVTPSTETRPTPPPESLTSEITAAEKELASLQTVRTMSHDMAAIRPGSDVVYQSSSQADILRAPAPATPVVASEAPRWETDTK